MRASYLELQTHNGMSGWSITVYHHVNTSQQIVLANLRMHVRPAASLTSVCMSVQLRESTITNANLRMHVRPAAREHDYKRANLRMHVRPAAREHDYKRVHLQKAGHSCGSCEEKCRRGQLASYSHSCYCYLMLASSLELRAESSLDAVEISTLQQSTAHESQRKHVCTVRVQESG
jgi:hypothetical protein